MHLCPHESDILIKDIIQKIDHIVLMRSLMKLFNQAIYSFKNRELSNFDAQVGENLCQIRAYKIYQLSQSQSFYIKLISLSEQISLSISNLDQQEQEYKYWLTRNKADRPSFIREPLHMSEFFFRMNVITIFEEDMYFIFLCYFLYKYCIADDEKIPFTMNYASIQEDLKLSKSFSKRMVHYYQKHLSELSCNFIFKLLDDLPMFNELSWVLPLLHKKSDEGRQVLPCFLVTKIIVQHMIEHELEIILVCRFSKSFNKQVAYIFKGYEQSLTLTSLDQQYFDSNYLIFYGEHDHSGIEAAESFLSKIKSVGLKNIILYNNAAHPQFSGKVLLDYKEDPFAQLMKEDGINLNSFEIKILEELSLKILDYKNNANVLGCTKDSRRLFLLKHIFCDTAVKYRNILYTS